MARFFDDISFLNLTGFTRACVEVRSLSFFVWLGGLGFLRLALAG